MRSFYPPEGHDFVHTPHIRKIQDNNQSQLEANLVYQTAQVRERLFNKLDRCNALASGTGWAIFQLKDMQANSGNVEMLGEYKEILLAALRPADIKTDLGQAPVLRIMTNELFVTDQGQDWLVRDLTIDSCGDSRYLVGAYNLAQPQAESKVPLFFVINSHLGFTSNYEDLTESYDLAYSQNSDEQLLPFGHYACSEDVIHNLQIGQEILDEVVNRAPDYVFTPTPQVEQ